MRLLVCSTRDQANREQRENPEDKAVVIGDRVHQGYTVSEMVDLTYIPSHNLERDAEWWQYAQTRVKP